jgi:hypothetical protein
MSNLTLYFKELLVIFKEPIYTFLQDKPYTKRAVIAMIQIKGQ